MAILLKTTSVRVSSIQIIQVRVQNKGKSVWKSRYDGDVSISWSLSACSLGFALSTLSPHYIYIYTLEALRSFARVCYIHSLSPSSLDLNKTALASVSLSPLTAGEGGVRIPSHREGEEVQRSLYRLRRGRQSTASCAILFHPAPMRKGL